MVAANDARASAAPPLGPALAAMTALQAIVALALFAPGVLAPRLGVSETGIALFTTGCFAVGMVGAFGGGALVARFGAFGVAALCMAAVIASMAVVAAGTHPALLLIAGLVLGLAFGPETPASSALLGRLARPEQRPLVFSLRQTGNQIGAILGSLTLPALAFIDPRLGFAVVIAAALVGVAAFLSLRGRYDPLTRRDARAASPRAAWALLRTDPRVARLAAVSVPYSAMQLALNAFLVTYLVGSLDAPHVTAGLMLGVAQAGGLVGRLSWGVVATRIGASTPVIAGLGVGMGLCALALARLPVQPPFALAATVVFLLGLTASGWNGVFLAEVARIAPEGRVADATGAVLTASYAGLLAGPLLISILAATGGLSLAYAVIGVGAMGAAIWMIVVK
jgi:MFS family permease